jgi:hypothetical protein
MNTSENEDDSDFSSYDGLELETIFGLTKNDGKIWFLIKWKDQASTALVEAEYLNAKFPQLVIEHYESVLRFIS